MLDPTDKILLQQPSNRSWWWVFVLVVLAVMFVLAHGRSQFSNMRLVTRIALPQDAIFTQGSGGSLLLIGADNGVLMGVETSSVASAPSTTFTLYGWDGKMCWQVVAPVDNPLDANCGGYSPKYKHSFIALSQDGHVFALAQDSDNARWVCSWRDGQLLGKARLPLVKIGTSSILHATNNGRVWLTSKLYPSPRVLVWSVYGDHARSEISQPAFHEARTCFERGNASIYSGDYMAPRSIIRNSADDDLLLHVHLPPPERSWRVPNTVDFDGFSCQNGGHTVLLAEYDTRLLRFIYKLGPGISSAWHIVPHQWLAVYTAPGKLRAIQQLPPKGKSLVLALQLSPDGHRVAIIHDYRHARKELQFYQW